MEVNPYERGVICRMKSVFSPGEGLNGSSSGSGAVMSLHLTVYPSVVMLTIMCFRLVNQGVIAKVEGGGDSPPR